MGDQVVGRTFTLRKPSALSGVYELSEGSVVLARIRQSSWTRKATAEVNGETWLLPARGLSSRRMTVTRQATGELLAEVRGRKAWILGRPGFRWRRTGLWTGWAFTDPDGRVVASFTRLRGAWRPSLTVQAMSGDAYVDLLCAVLGSRLLMFRRQQN